VFAQQSQGPKFKPQRYKKKKKKKIKGGKKKNACSTDILSLLPDPYDMSCSAPPRPLHHEGLKPLKL
jgi:hypothetical protein